MCMYVCMYVCICVIIYSIMYFVFVFKGGHIIEVVVDYILYIFYIV